MVKIEKLFIEYDELNVPIKNLSLNLKEGEKVALLGKNGAGKTTLLQTIVGLLKIKSGSIQIDGLEVEKKNMTEIRRKAGYVFQNPDDQLFMPTVLDDICFAPLNCKMDIETAEKKAIDLLKYFNLEDEKDFSPLKLSGGTKRLVCIASILITNPKVILFDEPTAYLDFPAKQKLIKTINDLTQTTMIATHDLRFCMKTCDRIVLLNDGKIALDFLVKDINKHEKDLSQFGIETVV